MKLLDEYILHAGGRSLIIKESETQYHTNREFKDGMFRLLFSQKKAALELLNALEGTSRTDEEKIEIDTLESALYKRRRNDLAFQYDSAVLSIVEHMSTWSENMPVRELAYLGRTYEKILPDKDLYREKRRMIPVPRLYVLYNGLPDKPLETIQRLSDAFPAEEMGSMLELRLKVININYNKGHPILDRSSTLRQYAQFVDRVRGHMKQAAADGKETDRDEAIRASVESCIKDGILEDFLKRHGSEVHNMLMDVTWEEFWEIRMEEAEEIGEMRGREIGQEIGRMQATEEKDRQFVTNLLKKGWGIDQIHEVAEVPVDKILEIKTALDS